MGRMFALLAIFIIFLIIGASTGQALLAVVAAFFLHPILWFGWTMIRYFRNPTQMEKEVEAAIKNLTKERRE